MSKHIFYEGQEVGCLMHGEGVVVLIGDRAKVEFKSFKIAYSINGVLHDGCRPTLYPIEQYREIIANLPAPQPEKWQPKPGEWCCFWDCGHNEFLVAQFKEYRNNSVYPYKIIAGAAYKHCAPFTGELPEHLKGGAE